jgi:flagellar biogenesis protein FliO
VAATVISGSVGTASNPIFLGNQAPAPAASQSTGGMLQLTIYLVLIGGMLIGGLYLTRGGFANLMQRSKGDKKLQISESRTLGNRQFLVVAEYEGRKMLLGVCPGRIDYLSTLAAGGDETFSADLEDKE